MKFLDRYLRDWRIRMAAPFIRPHDRVLDIGCYDGYLFEKLKTKPLSKSVGLDPLLPKIISAENYTLLPEYFPKGMADQDAFDCITMLAVLEHIPREQQVRFNDEFHKILNTSGRVIITVPSPLVDYILAILTRLRLIDGMSVDEHFGFQIKEVFELFDKNEFQLIAHKKFQLGLNNLFIFEKI